MRLLGLDYGTKRIGVAIGDTETKLALPLMMLDGTGDYLSSLAKIIKEEKIKLLIIGAPKDLRNEQGKTYQLVKDFIKILSPLKIKIVLEDERFSTKEVEKAMQQYGRAKRGVQKDAAAAAIILQGYLDRVKNF